MIACRPNAPRRRAALLAVAALIGAALLPLAALAQDAPPPQLPDMAAPALPRQPASGAAAPDASGLVPPAVPGNAGTGEPGAEAPLPPVPAAAVAAPAEDLSGTEPYFDTGRSQLPGSLPDEAGALQGAAGTAARFLRDGGPSIWAIAALSVITLAIILWKIWRLALAGAWSKGRARKAVAAYEQGAGTGAALHFVAGRRGVRSKVVRAALAAKAQKTDAHAREETLRVAKHELAEAAVGLRALELIATIAPLLGLLGTVLGMISAFQALQESGSRADPAMLAGGIWEALLTTAAGMAVAIPASAALSWFEAVTDRMRRDIEDSVTRIFVATPAPAGAAAGNAFATAAE